MTDKEDKKNDFALDTKSLPTELVDCSSPIITSADKKNLDDESIQIISKVLAETDVNKAKDLTHLFNLNQNKKTMMRVNKLNNLLDVLTEQTLDRFTQNPEEIETSELLQGLKIVQDIAERGQKQVNGVDEMPLIQVNQQNNKINIGDNDPSLLSRESRDNIKNAVSTIMAGLNRVPIKQDSTDIISGQTDSTSEGSEK